MCQMMIMIMMIVTIIHYIKSLTHCSQLNPCWICYSCYSDYEEFFCVVTQSSLITAQCFRGTYRPHHQVWRVRQAINHLKQRRSSAVSAYCLHLMVPTKYQTLCKFHSVATQTTISSMKYLINCALSGNLLYFSSAIVYCHNLFSPFNT
jgi:hypothetical protein